MAWGRYTNRAAQAKFLLRGATFALVSIAVGMSVRD
jgi:hypothetical protein